MTERNIFDELMQGMQELKDHQEEKTALEPFEITERPPATNVPDKFHSLRGNGIFP